MDKDTAIRFLRALNAKSIQVGSKWVTASCVLAPWTHQSGKDAHPSFAIQLDPNNESHYNCFSCGGGDLITLVHRMVSYGATSPQYDLKTAMALAVEDGDRPVSFHVKEWGERVESEPYVTYPELWLSSFMPAIQSPRATKYLHKRGLSDSVITALDLRYDTEKNAVCFPIRDFDGVLCGLRARRLSPTEEQPRYHIYKTGTGQHNRLVWYGEHWLDFDKPVVMCESVFDVASVFRVYENVCAPMTAGFTEDRAKRMRQAVEIVTLFDEDKAGDGARRRINKFLPATPVTHVHPPEGKKDAGEMTTAELRELLSSLVKLKPEQP